MARVIFPSGGAFKAAKPQYVQAYRRPQRQQSSWLTDATRAVDLVGKVVDNPLVTYITNEIYNASRDMDPEEVAKGAMQKRAEAQQQRPAMTGAQRFARAEEAAAIRDVDNAEEIALQQQFAQRMQMPPAPSASMTSAQRFARNWEAAEDPIAAAQERAALGAYGRAPSRPEDVIQQRVGAPSPSQPIEAPVANVPQAQSPALATSAYSRIAKQFPNQTRAQIVDIANKERDAIAERLIATFEPKDVIGKMYARAAATMHANHQEYGNFRGIKPDWMYVQGGTAIVDYIDQQKEAPPVLDRATLNSMRNVQDVVAWIALNADHIDEGMARALVARAEQVAESTGGIRGLGGIKKGAREMVGRAILMTRGKRKKGGDREARIFKWANHLREGDKLRASSVPDLKNLGGLSKPKKGSSKSRRSGESQAEHPGLVMRIEEGGGVSEVPYSDVREAVRDRTHPNHIDYVRSLERQGLSPSDLVSPNSLEWYDSDIARKGRSLFVDNKAKGEVFKAVPTTSSGETTIRATKAATTAATVRKENRQQKEAKEARDAQAALAKAQRKEAADKEREKKAEAKELIEKAEKDMRAADDADDKAKMISVPVIPTRGSREKKEEAAQKRREALQRKKVLKQKAKRLRERADKQKSKAEEMKKATTPAPKRRQKTAQEKEDAAMRILNKTLGTTER